MNKSLSRSLVAVLLAVVCVGSYWWYLVCGWCAFDPDKYGVKADEDFYFHLSHILMEKDEPFTLEFESGEFTLSLHPTTADDRKKMDNLLSSAGAYR